MSDHRWHRHSGRLHFHFEGGKLWYYIEDDVSYGSRFHSGMHISYEAQGIVPQEIVDQGEEAILEYAEKEAREQINEQEKHHLKRDNYEKNPNFSLTTVHDGTVLRGKIISAYDSALVVRLDEPVQGDTTLSYNFASAMSGHFIFKGGQFTDYTIERAKGMLVTIYLKKLQNQETGKVISLEQKLNDRQRFIQF